MIRGVLFDKDGTLMQFSNFWVEALDMYLGSFSLKRERKEKIQKELGIDERKKVIENSILAKGSSSDIAQVLHKYTKKKIEKIERDLDDTIYTYLFEHLEKIVETCNVKKPLSSLKEKGYTIGVVTADSFKQTDFALRQLGIKNHIDFLATGDKYPNKPHTNSLDSFCHRFHLKREEVAMCGDSDIDMEYGAKTGLCIGILTGVGSKKMLQEYTDNILESVEQVEKYIKRRESYFHKIIQ